MTQRLLVALALLVLVACDGGPAPTPKALSVEEARQVAVSFENRLLEMVDEGDGEEAAQFGGDLKPEEAKALANAEPPNTRDGRTLAEFYHRRALARRAIGQTPQAAEDHRRAIEVAPRNMGGGGGGGPRAGGGGAGGDALDRGQIYFEAARTAFVLGHDRETIELLGEARAALRPQQWIRATHYAYNHARRLAEIGRFDEAEKAARDAEAAVSSGVVWPSIPASRIAEARSSAFQVRALVFDARGRHAEAEPYYRQALAAISGVEAGLDSRMFRDNGRQVMFRLLFSRSLLTQGRLTEAEALAREALAHLQQQSRPAPEIITGVQVTLGQALTAQGRYRDAEALYTRALDIATETRSQGRGLARFSLAALQALQGRWEDAAKSYAFITQQVETQGRDRQKLDSDLDRVTALAMIRDGQAAAAAALASRHWNEVYGPNHLQTRRAEALRGLALLRTGDQAEGRRLLENHVPNLLETSADTSDMGDRPAEDARNTVLVEALMTALAEVAGEDRPTFERLFRLAQSARDRSVTRALAAAATRFSAGDSDLARLLRDEQDTGRRLAAIEKLLAGGARDLDRAALRADADRLRAAHRTLIGEVERRYPAYSTLVEPQPIDATNAARALRPDEALLVFRLGGENGFVFALRQDGRRGFAKIGKGRAALAADIEAVRATLAPTGPTLGDLPDYDLAAAHRLYGDLIAPVAGALDGAKRVLVVPDGPLGALPLALLVTAPTAPPAEDRILFGKYRKVPWLGRQAAFAVLPSVATLPLMANLPPGDAGRQAFLGFGNPKFAADAPDAKPTQLASRGGPAKSVPAALRAVRVVGKDEADARAASPPAVSELSELPDTADELEEIAASLGADRGRDVVLGVKASPDAVRRADLLRRRVVAFATHGLIPGDLAGLAEPALALTPAAAGGSGDGLLRMSEIAGLRLDADWVVLSACNSGAGKGAGAEAVSGLGRAFLYAGARSVLVTNWAVESSSARALTTDLFRRQSADPKLASSE
ncbi:MAG: CHAT domain-containing protein, partial [Alphaproteobacteria bacterium]|nr:CHAT domain-containing protein [Alphaproteobacteria bacterium]